MTDMSVEREFPVFFGRILSAAFVEANSPLSLSCGAAFRLQRES